ncbi:predicted protein [Uncinocarpus reesii 1704]|uniref:Uncharacterized protein n=1 Tax=Uncinocarpus reesii (strain UAMH 1704) TaxID=336963 RepID=C4JHQ7_UNCRE|nr:uncharacterized protein UREG_02743 [Uncinocarpus reesii 1704]EEP77894.1 predicted protein [Uncinocarpus reesii 1704]
MESSARAPGSDRGLQLLIITVVMTAVSGIFVMLRLLFVVFFAVCNGIAIKHGFGKHTVTVPHSEKLEALKVRLCSIC